MEHQTYLLIGENFAVMSVSIMKWDEGWPLLFKWYSSRREKWGYILEHVIKL